MDDGSTLLTATSASDLNYQDYNVLLEDQGYMQPTIASCAVPSRQEELERVTASYRCGSYMSVKKLPKRLDYGEVLLARKDAIASNMFAGVDGFKPPASKNEPFHKQRYDTFKSVH